VPEEPASNPPVATLSGAPAPHRRRYLIIGAVVVALAVISVIVAAGSSPSTISGKVDTAHLTDAGAAPPLRAEGWINSPPLTAASLKGKVVLYDFWTYSCINCVRTFPKIRAWFDRYRADGLVVVGIHSPEFDFEKVAANVRGATKRLNVTWPVALDPDMTIWTEFQNQYWPADYVADRAGHVRYSHFGEGDYTNTENVLRKLLGVKASAPRADRNAKAETPSGESVNPETYLDVRHGQLDATRGRHDYPRASAPAPPGVALQGAWDATNEKIISADAGATIVAGVHAQSVNVVLAAPEGKPIDLVVTLDGAPVPPELRGANVHVDAQGRTVVTVSAPDMYRVVLAPAVADHELALTATAPGLEAYSFTFG
jgi:thiol-disulfide isomerase/thioredoxin